MWNIISVYIHIYIYIFFKRLNNFLQFIWLVSGILFDSKDVALPFSLRRKISQAKLM